MLFPAPLPLGHSYLFPVAQAVVTGNCHGFALVHTRKDLYVTVIFQAELDRALFDGRVISNNEDKGLAIASNHGLNRNA